MSQTCYICKVLHVQIWDKYLKIYASWIQWNYQYDQEFTLLACAPKNMPYTWHTHVLLQSTYTPHNNALTTQKGIEYNLYLPCFFHMWQQEICSSMHINQPNWQPWHWPTYLLPYEYALAHLPKVTVLACTAAAWHGNQSEQGEAVVGNLK